MRNYAPHLLTRPAVHDSAVCGAHIHDANRAVGCSKAHHGVKPADAGMLQLHIRCLVPVTMPKYT